MYTEDGEFQRPAPVAIVDLEMLKTSLKSCSKPSDYVTLGQQIVKMKRELQKQELTDSIPLFDSILKDCAKRIQFVNIW